MVPWGARYHYFGSSRDMLLTDFSEHPVVGLVVVTENGWLWKHGPLVLKGLITDEEMMVHLEVDGGYFQLWKPHSHLEFFRTPPETHHRNRM